MRRIALIGLLLTTPLAAQQPTLGSADALFQAQNWTGAAAEYEAIIKADSTQSMAWYRLGRTRYAQGRHEDALLAFNGALRHKFAPPVFVYFGIARAEVALGRTDAAFVTLDGIAKNGFAQLSSITGDPAFASLQSDARMQQIIARVERNAAPCRFSEEARQLDFWLGTWDVIHPVARTQMGTSVIEEHLNGCMIQENWMGAGGGTGKSMNFYDRAQKTWRQIWVAAAFSATDYTSGEYRDGAMRFRATTRGPNGEEVLNKLTFYNFAPDSVHQVFEASSDGGKTWRETWRGVYLKQKK